MASIGTVENEIFFQGWGVLKNANFANNGRRPKRTRYSSMSNQSTTGFCSPFPSRTFPSYLTHCRYEVNNHSSSLNEPEPLHTPAPPPNKRAHLMKDTPPPKYFITFDSTYWNYILGFELWASLSL